MCTSCCKVSLARQDLTVWILARGRHKVVGLCFTQLRRKVFRSAASNRLLSFVLQENLTSNSAYELNLQSKMPIQKQNTPMRAKKEQR